MGYTGDKNRRLWVIQGGAIEKVKATKQQRHVQPRRKEAQKASWWKNVLINVQKIMDLLVPDCEIKRATKVIFKVIKITLSSFSNILAKKVIL